MRTIVRALAAVVAMAFVLGERAAARPFGDLGGGAQLTYELAGMRDIARDVMPEPEPGELVLAGARLHGFAGGKWLGLHIGLDLAAGSTVRDAGFAYDVSLFPLGVAFRFAETSFVTLGAGIGANGAVGTLDDAATFPFEARFEIGRGIRVLGRVRVTYLRGATGREDGGTTVPIGDELEAMLGLRLGRGYADFGFPTGNGYFIGATARELLGAQFVGVVIGYSIDMGTRRSERTSRLASDLCEDCE